MSLRGRPPAIGIIKISSPSVSNVTQLACGEYRTRMISQDEDSVASKGWGVPPSGVTSRMERWASGPLTYATFRPLGCQTGKFPSGDNRRACPPSVGTNQTSPPYVRVSRFPALKPILTIRVRDARVDTKAIELPSGEKAGWKFSEALLVTLTS